MAPVEMVLHIARRDERTYRDLSQVVVDLRRSTAVHTIPVRPEPKTR